jgi:tetrapyrrole methylase family protein/MazG family protein/ATP diphosphatase
VPQPFDVPEADPLPEQTGASFSALVSLMQRLLAPDGCPWDREQTPVSLTRYVLEEACELIDAIESGSPESIRDELGDLALQIAFLGELYRARGDFGPDDVMSAICQKLVRRHPHVFGDADARDSREVEIHWERIKREEKRNRPLLDGIARNLPALLRAEQTSNAVARVGFDWPDAAGSRLKVDEELSELAAAIEQGRGDATEDEFGDVLFALVNWGRHLGISPERALRRACDKFRERFDQVEGSVKQAHGDWPRDERGRPSAGLPLETLDGYWNRAKQNGSR